MALITCPDCRNSVSNLAPSCVHCGRPLQRADDARLSVSTASAPEQAVLSADPAVKGTPLFSVATHKFIVLSICTLGIYELYWCYQIWSHLKTASGENIRPFWRAAFAPLWAFALFHRIQDEALAAGVAAGWSAGALATAYFVLNAAWRLPDPWWLITFGSWIPMLPVQQSVQRMNSRYALEPGERNHQYTAANVLTIAFGGLLVVLSVLGALLPE